jgi:hypothetical protein
MEAKDTLRHFSLVRINLKVIANVNAADYQYLAIQFDFTCCLGC